MPGPIIRSDIVEVYVFRRRVPHPRALRRPQVEFLQLHRCKGTLPGTWQPVMGHIEGDEKAPAAALRELREETSIDAAHGLINFWHLESVNTFYLASHECIVMSPGFAAEIRVDTEPTLDDAHDAFRWVAYPQIDRRFLWPGQRAAIHQIVDELLAPDAPGEPLLRLPFE